MRFIHLYIYLFFFFVFFVFFFGGGGGGGARGRVRMSVVVPWTSVIHSSMELKGYIPGTGAITELPPPGLL